MMVEVWRCDTHGYVFNLDPEYDDETVGWDWYCPDSVIGGPVCVHRKYRLEPTDFTVDA